MMFIFNLCSKCYGKHGSCQRNLAVIIAHPISTKAHHNTLALRMPAHPKGSLAFVFIIQSKKCRASHLRETVRFGGIALDLKFHTWQCKTVYPCFVFEGV